MATSNGMGKLQLLGAVMALFMLLAVFVQARKHVDEACYGRCSSGCPRSYKPPGIRAACLSLCSRQCQVQQPLAAPEDAPGNCVLSCENSMCSNINSADVNKAEGCVDACAEKCKKN